MHSKLAILLVFVVAVTALAQTKPASSAPGGDMQTISPADLVALLGKSAPKPLILQVGPARLFRYNHIRGAEYAGPASEPEGIAALRKRVQSLPKSAAIVIYCGCCPWDHCPNVKPASDELRKLGFTNVKVLYLPNNFKFDWEDKGYPTEKGGVTQASRLPRGTSASRRSRCSQPVVMLSEDVSPSRSTFCFLRFSANSALILSDNSGC